jgi:murein biosynthesis integral membrane protein MurJ
MIDIKKIVQATTVVTAIALVVKGLGFVEKILLAYFFGTGIQVDAYLIAYTIPFSAFVVLREVVEPSFLPVFVQTLRGSGRDGWRLFSVFGTLLLLLLGAATIIGILLAAPLISITAPGFAGEQRTLAVQLTRLVMPALFLLGLSTLTTAALHAQKRFALPALGLASFRAGPLVLFLVLGGIQGLALGVILGALGKLVLESLGLRRYLDRVRPALDLAFPPVRTVGRLAAPLLAALSLSLFVGPLVENAFASRMGVGGVSALAYARKIAETLTTILPYALGLVLLPFSAEMAARQENQALAKTLSGAVRALTLLFLPVTIGLMALREPFVQLLFERGAFTAASTELTAGPLLFYALALLPFSLEVIVVPFYFARQDTLTPVIADVLAFLLNVILIPPLMSVLGLGGIALAVAIAKALKVIALLILFGRRVPAFRLASLGPFAGQMVLASLAAAGALTALQLGQSQIFQWLSQSLAEGRELISLLAYLASAGILGGGVFFVVAYLLRVDEIRYLWDRGWAWCRRHQLTEG